jgi:hypothetical protein
MRGIPASVSAAANRSTNLETCTASRMSAQLSECSERSHTIALAAGVTFHDRFFDNGAYQDVALFVLITRDRRTPPSAAPSLGPEPR